MYATTARPATIRPATEKQIAFVMKLWDEKVGPNVPADNRDEARLGTFEWATGAGSRAVSASIDSLLALPRPQRLAVTAHAPADTATQTGEGIYLVDGAVIKVVKSRGTGNLYAKRLVLSAPRVTAEGTEVDADFVYAPGVIRTLRPEQKMSIEAAKAFAVQHGICANCGRKLKAAKSVEAGIGPVCIKKFG